MSDKTERNRTLTEWLEEWEDFKGILYRDINYEYMYLHKQERLDICFTPDLLADKVEEYLKEKDK